LYLAVVNETLIFARSVFTIMRAKPFFVEENVRFSQSPATTLADVSDRLEKKHLSWHDTVFSPQRSMHGGFLFFN
jgi:hypothetical protein